MNTDLVKRLAGQAYVQACLELQQADPATWYSDRGPPQELVNQKFAELIVKECINVMESAGNDAKEKFLYMGDDVPTYIHQRNILDHFGVKP
jgi:hypothetical protein